MTCNSSAALSSGANGTLGGGKVYFHTDNNQYVMQLTLAKHSSQPEKSCPESTQRAFSAYTVCTLSQRYEFIITSVTHREGQIGTNDKRGHPQFDGTRRDR